MAGAGGHETLRQRVRQLALQGSSVEQRDLAVSQAVTRCQWWLVSQLVQLGVSRRHRAGQRYCLWDFVEELFHFGHHGEAGRQLPHTAATDRGVWELVFTALCLGVDRQPLIRVLREEGCRELWQLAPCLVRQHNTPRLTDLVLQAALGCCQWGCVGQLVRHGLCPTQQRLVCREALDWGHWHCALELLRQGCEAACAESVVLEAFRLNRCHELVEIFKEDGIKPCVREAMFQIANDHGFLDLFLAVLADSGAREKEMVDVIAGALHGKYIAAILPILSTFAFAKRVLKQLAIKEQIPEAAILCLHTYLIESHPDLIFYILVAQKMWERVTCMLGDTRISGKQRRFALKHAIKKCAWKAVRSMVRSRSLGHSDRRFAFLQSAREGKWRLALRLSRSSSTISVSDKLFALRTWLKRGLWNCVDRVYRQWVGMDGSDLNWEDEDTTEQFLDCVLEESTIAGQLEPFLDACCKSTWEDIDTDSTFQTAVDHDQSSFVLGYCLKQKCTDDFMGALEIAIKKQKWNLLSDLVKETYDCVEDLDWSYRDYEESIEARVLGVCLNGVSKYKTSWDVVVPALDEFCGKLTRSDAPNNEFDGIIDRDAGDRVQRLAAWCLEHSFANAALVFSVLSSAKDILPQVTTRLGNSISSDVLSFCFNAALDWDAAAICLQCLPINDAESTVCEFENDNGYEDLMDTFRAKGQHQWAMYVGVWTEDWEVVNLDLPNCVDRSVIAYAIRKASASDQWEIVRANLNRSSRDNDVLSEILQNALKAGQLEICTVILPQVDISHSSVSSQSLLQAAVTSSGDREDMLTLCIRFGLSTHAASCSCSGQSPCSDCWPSPLRTVLRNGQLPLVKLVYRTGVCSNTQLFQCSQDTDLRTQLEGQNRHDIVQYLDDVATTPRTLQDLCRLRVSHLIGCHPGHQDRIESLQVPGLVKNFVRFEDVLS